jgi:hypothetical protein
MSVGEYRLFEDAEAALARAGGAPEVSRRQSEDDGGIHDVDTYHYHELEIDVVRGAVSRIRTSGRRLRGPRNFQVGSSRSEVEEQLRRWGVIVHASPDTLDIPECGAPIAYLTLIFSANRIQAIEVAAKGP